MTNSLNEDNIRVAAYYIWEQAGRPEGKEKECWIKACEQLFAAGIPNKEENKKASKKASSKSTVKAAKTTKSADTKVKPAAKSPVSSPKKALA